MAPSWESLPTYQCPSSLLPEVRGQNPFAVMRILCVNSANITLSPEDACPKCFFLPISLDQFCQYSRLLLQFGIVVCSVG